MSSTTSRHRHIIIAATGAALVAAVLAGCSNSGDAAPTGTPTRATATAPAFTTPTPTPTSTVPVPADTRETTGTAATRKPTPAAPASKFRLDDAATWTISGDEVGPIAIGGRTVSETDDLSPAFTMRGGECPAAPETQFWTSTKGPNLIITDNHGTVSGVAVGDYEPGSLTMHGPTTKAGAGIGTSLDELQRMYPELTYAGTYLDERGAYSKWRLNDDGGPVVFQLGEDGVHVGMIWVSDHPLPYEFCG